MRWLLLCLAVLYLLASTVTSHAAMETGLHVWIRDLDDHGVAGVRLSIIDANKQPRDVATNAEGIALITPLPGDVVRIVGATSADGQSLLMDENDPNGGLRIPLQLGAVQALDLRISDGMLFVEPVAEAEDADVAPVAAPAEDGVSTSIPVHAANADVSVIPPTPDAVAAQNQWGWLRWLVVGVVVTIVMVTIAWQVLSILRARRLA